MEELLNELYAKVGRQHVQLEKQDAAFTQVLSLAAGLVNGEIDRSRVLINLTDRAWMVVPAGERPPMPATVNGLPRCVVAPETAAPEPIADVAPELLARNGSGPRLVTSDET